jgi:hypothetical protein
MTRPRPYSPASGSNDGLGIDFWPSGINGLEMVELAGIEPATS